MSDNLIEKSLILIKPDGVQRCLVGRVLQRFEDVGLKIVAMKLIQVNSDFAKQHYEEHVGKKFFPLLDEMITSGPVVAMVLEGVEAVALVRKMVGATEPKSSAPGTIRGDFSHVSYGYADAKGLGVKNVIHASANLDDANREVGLWFKPDEIYNYRTVHDTHILD